MPTTPLTRLRPRLRVVPRIPPPVEPPEPATARDLVECIVWVLLMFAVIGILAGCA